MLERLLEDEQILVGQEEEVMLHTARAPEAGRLALVLKLHYVPRFQKTFRHKHMSGPKREADHAPFLPLFGMGRSEMRQEGPAKDPITNRTGHFPASYRFIFPHRDLLL